MEFFIKTKFIRLRSHHNRYLVAGSDGESVKQSKHGNTKQACWIVEVVQAKPNTIRLRSCYDKFLTASEEPFLLGWTGKKALQTVQTDSNLSVQWQPIGEDFYVKLQAPITGKFLRANAGTPPWRNTVTVDVPERKATQDWVQWVVDILDDDAAIGNIDRCYWPRNSKTLSHTNKAIECYKTSYSLAENATQFNSSVSSFEDESDHSRQSSVSSGSSTSSASVVGAYKSSTGMELFQNAKTVRLRSHNDKYLIAEDDGESVCQDRHGGSKYARWTVEYVKSVESVDLVRFKGCYNKYLTATDDEFLLGVTGKKVKQTLPRRLDSSIEWEPMRDGMQVKLKTRYGNFLRANGGLPPWRNSITHDVPSRSHTQDWILWEIEVLEVYDVVQEVVKFCITKTNDTVIKSPLQFFSTSPLPILRQIKLRRKTTGILPANMAVKGERNRLIQIYTILGLLLSCYVSNISALSVTVNDVECIYEYVLYEGDTISGNFVVVDHDIFWSSDHPGIDFTVTSPAGNVVHNQKGTAGDKFELKAPRSGMYKFCFHNPYSAPETVSFYIHVGHIPSEHNIAKDEHLDPINVKIAELREELESVTAEQKYLKARDTRHRHTNESTRKRVIFYTLAEYLMLIAASGLQVVYIRKLFSKSVGYNRV